MLTMKALLLVILVIIHETYSVSINKPVDFKEPDQNVTESKELSRKKRFLLFPVGAALLVSIMYILEICRNIIEMHLPKFFNLANIGSKSQNLTLLSHMSFHKHNLK